MRRSFILTAGILLIPAVAFAVDRALIEKAKSGDSFDRSGATRPLAKDGSPAAAKLLLDLVSDSDPYVRDAAVLAGGSLTNPAGVKVVAGGIRTKKELLRLNLAELLGRTGSRPAVKRYIETVTNWLSGIYLFSFGGG